MDDMTGLYGLGVIILLILWVGLSGLRKKVPLKNTTSQETEDFIIRMANRPHYGMTPYNQVVDNLMAGKYSQDFNTLSSVIPYLLNDGRHFTAGRNLSGLSIPISKDGRTLAHVLTQFGYDFSLAELIEMGNPKDEHGISVAHELLSLNPKRFAFLDVVALNNPKDDTGRTLAHQMAENGYIFTVEELVAIGNPVDIFNETVASVQARLGYYFTPEQIYKLAALTRLSNRSN